MASFWHFRNEEFTIISNPFKKKYTFSLKGKDAAIELYVSKLEEDVMATDTRLSHSSFTNEDRVTLYSLRDYTSTIIKEA